MRFVRSDRRAAVLALARPLLSDLLAKRLQILLQGWRKAGESGATKVQCVQHVGGCEDFAALDQVLRLPDAPLRVAWVQLGSLLDTGGGGFVIAGLRLNH